jgi:hypothetical protein
MTWVGAVAHLRLAAVILLLVLPGTSGCSQFAYNVHAVNYGDYGVILIAPLTTRHHRLITPGVPGVGQDFRWMGQLEGHPNSLPDEVEVVWQLAELTDCSYEREAKSQIKGGPDQRLYVRKNDCTVTPIEGKVFRKTVDLAAIRDSPEGQKAGTYDGLRVLNAPRYILGIKLLFRDDQLEVETYLRKTNPWV